MTTLIDKLQWRYATKKMNPALPVPQDKLDRILEAVRLTATSSGLQPYEVLIVQDPAVCLLAREVCPQLEIHASTQMTISSEIRNL